MSSLKCKSFGTGVRFIGENVDVFFVQRMAAQMFKGPGFVCF